MCATTVCARKAHPGGILSCPKIVERCGAATRHSAACRPGPHRGQKDLGACARAAAHLERLPDVLERARAAVIEAVARAQHARLSRAQRAQHVVQVGAQLAAGGVAVGGIGRLIARQHVRERQAAVEARQRRFQARRQLVHLRPLGTPGQGKVIEPYPNPNSQAHEADECARGCQSELAGWHS